MSPTSQTIALMAAQSLPSETAGKVPEWVHLLPAGRAETMDGRGPYLVNDLQAVINASFNGVTRLPIDENHATDLAAKTGGPAPARGWIVAMEAREDGIWGQVEWTESGKALLHDQAYRGLSPVIGIETPTSKTILAIKRASLTNRPNLRDLTALNNQQDSDMSLLERLAKLAGLEATATEDEVMAALEAKMTPKGDATAMQAQLTEIGAALGVESASPADILAAANARKTEAANPAEIVALQTEIATLTTQVNTLTEGASRKAAEAYIDGEIKRGRAGLKPVRDRYVALHMANADDTVALVEALPLLNASGTSIAPPAPKDGTVALQSEQATAAKLLGLPVEKYLETLKSEEAL